MRTREEKLAQQRRSQRQLRERRRQGRLEKGWASELYALEMTSTSRVIYRGKHKLGHGPDQ